MVVPPASSEDELPYDSAAIDVLVVRLQGGDASVSEELIRAIHVPLRQALSMSAPNVEVLEEAVQSSLVSAFTKIAQYRPERTFLPWVKAIARNRLRDLRAETARHGPLLEDRLSCELAQPGPGTEDTLEPDEALTALNQCLGALEPSLRRLVERHHGEGISIRRLAQLARRSEAWVATTLYRVRNSLRTCLQVKGVGL